MTVIEKRIIAIVLSVISFVFAFLFGYLAGDAPWFNAVKTSIMHLLGQEP